MNNKNIQLFEVLEEQHAFEFTGRVNVLNGATKQLKAVLYFRQGEIIHVEMGELDGVRALLNVLNLECLSADPTNYVPEPEIIEVSPTISEEFNQLKISLYQYATNLEAIHRHRPPAHVKLRVNPQIIWEGDEITPSEFDLMALVTEFSLVQEIYQHTTMLEHETTLALISLRKKNALLVIEK